ncbi:nicotinate-nucleotide--dimethylbenzimidazole phosphoribosyltransferase [Saccharomonospora sp. CUA-673]|uniref:nicotinate-nucleotide--dimethylbenzimidazole phosphoribosyltransferase n=1 Tax=Saccharomonospora sp. CUA-673 TaxID=1904969 RepID=UPI0009635EF6|nr:nicotinate-nucleotide--dimethylbenzimidazole phosphoribosyltransferase [Saccharomonospora sp. CUA-673]OLT46967.1 nicotinate-nucleotide--dimethylbenzimidazole phosphoribosyltransferase [Saccharomonospora sp. CUA-673]
MSSIEFGPVSLPDEHARAGALQRHAALLTPERSMGRLERLGAWVSACQGRTPPKPLRRMRVVVFAADHGVVARGVSRGGPGTTRELLTALDAGGTALNVLADTAGAGIRVVDVGTDGDATGPDHVRRGSGSIDVEDALTEDETVAAVRAGMRAADAEVDEGADLLVAADIGAGVTTPASALVASLTDTEPVAVIGRGSGIDDNGWMRKATVVRDALRRCRAVTGEPLALLRTAGGADLAAMTGFLAQAAVRRTPVVLDGLPSAAAALLAEELAPGARSWWLAAHRAAEPAQVLALNHLDLDPVVDLDIRLGAGAGAATVLPLLSAAVRLLTDVADKPTLPADADIT